VNNSLPNLPAHFETERLVVRRFQPGDGAWYYAVSQKNRQHLMRYESENVVMEIASAEDAETVVRDLAAAWEARKSFLWRPSTRKLATSWRSSISGP
jgi:hypothetical protein